MGWKKLEKTRDCGKVYWILAFFSRGKKIIVSITGYAIPTVEVNDNSEFLKLGEKLEDRLGKLININAK